MAKELDIMGGNGGDSKNDDQKNNKQVFFDRDTRINYEGPWVLNNYNGVDNKGNSQWQTYHSTSQNNSTLLIPFNTSSNVSQISVKGVVTQGEARLIANYTVDNGSPVQKEVPIVAGQAVIQPFQDFFDSSVQGPGLHNLSIRVLETGSGRNYSFQVLSVTEADGKGKGNGNGNNNSHPKPDMSAGTIVGVVLGTVIFIALALLVVFYIWRRKRVAQISNHGPNRLPPMMYYARPISDRYSRERGFYSREPASIIDTDSKFTFTAHGNFMSEPRQSWVPVDLPPSVPHSVVSDARTISDWSTYKGSSVIVEQSHVDRSHFSPYTTTTLSPMLFKGPSLPSNPRPVRGAPSRTESLNSSSSSLGPYEIHKF